MVIEMDKSETVIHFVNKTGQDISSVMPHFKEALKTGVLHDDIADLFEIVILKAFNADGTDRMIIDFAA